MRIRWLYLGLSVILILGIAGGMWFRNRVVGRQAEAGVNKALACHQQADAFTDYPLLYAGDNVLGYPLISCQHDKTANRYDDQGRLLHSATDSFAFAYGTCVIPAGRDSCAIPVTIIIDPPCSNFQVSPAFAKERVTVRGAEAMVDENGTIWFETPTYKVSVYPPEGGTYAERKGKAVAIMEGLLPANALAAPLTKAAPLTTALGPSTVCP